MRKGLVERKKEGRRDNEDWRELKEGRRVRGIRMCYIYV